MNEEDKEQVKKVKTSVSNGFVVLGYVVFALLVLLILFVLTLAITACMGPPMSEFPRYRFPPPQPSNQTSSLKILTFNFQSSAVAADRSGSLRTQRLIQFVDWMKRETPDIVLGNEGWNFQNFTSVWKEVARHLAPEYEVIYNLGIGIPGIVYDSNAILIKTQYRLHDEQNYKLPASTRLVGGDRRNWIWSFGPASYLVGCRIWLDSSTPAYVYSTHLLTPSKQIPALNHLIRSHIQSFGDDPEDAFVILGGDFNVIPTDPVFEQFLHSFSWINTSAPTHNTTVPTYAPNPFLPHYNPLTNGAGQLPPQNEFDPLNRQIDYILIRPSAWQVLDWKLVFPFPLPFSSVWMSDHYGVQAMVGWSSGLGFGFGLGYHHHHHEEYTQDSAKSAQSTPTRLIEWDEDTPSDLNIYVTSKRGLTIWNKSKKKKHGGGLVFHIVSGPPGHVWTQDRAWLSPGQIASFVFEQQGVYHYQAAYPKKQFTGLIYVQY